MDAALHGLSLEVLALPLLDGHGLLRLDLRGPVASLLLPQLAPLCSLGVLLLLPLGAVFQLLLCELILLRALALPLDLGVGHLLLKVQSQPSLQLLLLLPQPCLVLRVLLRSQLVQHGPIDARRTSAANAADAAADADTAAGGGRGGPTAPRAPHGQGRVRGGRGVPQVRRADVQALWRGGGLEGVVCVRLTLLWSAKRYVRHNMFLGPDGAV
mmetsp:Transcript_19393/g.56343  ORF Transcript_19393/g.56343 Transcript_19393/m.56343 type:complete len:213 (-) Transcript_19393:825-1463(-)